MRQPAPSSPLGSQWLSPPLEASAGGCGGFCCGVLALQGSGPMGAHVHPCTPNSRTVQAAGVNKHFMLCLGLQGGYFLGQEGG